MIKLTYFDRLKKIHQLISQQSTGNTEAFAAQLGISRSQLFVYLKEMRSNGAPIQYSRIKQTYYYKHPTTFCLIFNQVSADETKFNSQLNLVV